MDRLSNRRHDIFSEQFPPSLPLIREFMKSVADANFTRDRTLFHEVYKEAVIVWLIEAGYTMSNVGRIAYSSHNHADRVYQVFEENLKKDRVYRSMWEIVLASFGDPKNGQDRPLFGCTDRKKYRETRVRSFNVKIKPI